jgi:hypothetical protein
MNEPPRLEAVIYLLPGGRVNGNRPYFSLFQIINDDRQSFIMLAHTTWRRVAASKYLSEDYLIISSILSRSKPLNLARYLM